MLSKYLLRSLIVKKLLAISLHKPPNLLKKMNFFTHIFQGFYLDFNLLFIVFFLRNHFGRLFHVSMGAVCFSDGGASFISGRVGCPIGGRHWFWGGEFKKKS